MEIRCRNQVREVGRDESSGSFRIVTNQGNFVSQAIVIATGGLSIPTLGATDFGYRIARQFGLQIEGTRPGLVPFTLERSLQNHWAKLSGVSVEARVRCGATEFREHLLITHRGLSGPAVLQISSYWQAGAVISIDLLPDHDPAGAHGRVRTRFTNRTGESARALSSGRFVEICASFMQNQNR